MKKNFFYNFLLTGSNLLFPLLIFPYLTRVLGAKGLGITNFITSYGQNYIIIAALGIPVYGIREIAKVGNDIKKRSKIFFEIWSLHFILTILLLIIYIFSIFLSPDLYKYKELALVGGSLIFLNVFSIEWVFSGVSDFKYITTRNLIIRVISLLAIFLLVKTKDDLFIYFIITVTTVFFTASVDVFSAKKFITRNVVITVKGVLTHIRPVIYLGIYMVLTSIYSVLPTTLLGFFSSKAAVGYFVGANKIIRMVISLFSSLVVVMVPQINLIAENKDNEKYFSLINKSLNIVIIFGIPMAVLIFLLANPLVMLLAGKGFVNSIFLIQVMAPIILIVPFAQVFVLLILNVNRKEKEMIILSSAGMLLSLVINVIFIPYFAEKATAFSQLAAELLVTTAAYFLAKRCLNFEFPSKKLLLNLLCVVPFVLVAYLAMRFLNNNLLRLVLSGTVCVLYFLYYQYYLLKDEFFIALLKPFKIKLTGARS
jgi:O-antigen/teichoic acid export membrane protein